MGAILSALFMKLPQTPCTETDYVQIPMPKCMHQNLTPSQIQNKDVIIIGDVHGCLDELQQLIQLAEKTFGSDCVYIFVGDLMNKGPKSVETLHFVRQLNCFLVRGNHEEKVIKNWLDFQSGSITQYSKKYGYIKHLTSEDIEYLMELPYTITIPAKAIKVVHAGLTPWRSINSHQRGQLVTTRNIKDIDILDPKQTPDIREGVPWASVWPGPEHVYFGHDARRGLQLYSHATGLDTGCVYGGSLSAVNVSQPTAQVISVPAKSTYRVAH